MMAVMEVYSQNLILFHYQVCNIYGDYFLHYKECNKDRLRLSMHCTVTAIAVAS